MTVNRLKKNSILDSIFCIILFLALFLPSNDVYVIKSIGITLKSLLFIFLAIINLFGNKNSQFNISKKIKILSVVFISITFFTEIFIKPVYYLETMSNGFKSFYIGMPLFLGLSLLIFNLRINIKMIWNTLCIAVLVSILLSVLSLFIYIPIYQEDGYLSNFSESIKEGRLMNANASFGFIGFIILMKYQDRWFCSKLFYKIVYGLSICALIFTFNRTFLGFLIFGYIYLFIKDFSTKNLTRNLTVALFLILALVLVYNMNEYVKDQFDNRILYLFDSSVKSNDRLFENNRDMIYDGILKNIEEGYWIIGLPWSKPMFFMHFLNQGSQYTDTSLANILLRFGVFPLIIFIIILKNIYKTSRSLLFRFPMVIFVLASFNIDSLYRHNTIFFIIILYFLCFNLNKRRNENTILN